MFIFSVQLPCLSLLLIFHCTALSYFVSITAVITFNFCSANALCFLLFFSATGPLDYHICYFYTATALPFLLFFTPTALPYSLLLPVPLPTLLVIFFSATTLPYLLIFQCNCPAFLVIFFRATALSYFLFCQRHCPALLV